MASRLGTDIGAGTSSRPTSDTLLCNGPISESVRIENEKEATVNTDLPFASEIYGEDGADDLVSILLRNANPHKFNGDGNSNRNDVESEMEVGEFLLNATVGDDERGKGPSSPQSKFPAIESTFGADMDTSIGNGTSEWSGTIGNNSADGGDDPLFDPFIASHLEEVAGTTRRISEPQFLKEILASRGQPHSSENSSSSFQNIFEESEEGDEKTTRSSLKKGVGGKVGVTAASEAISLDGGGNAGGTTSADLGISAQNFMQFKTTAQMLGITIPEYILKKYEAVASTDDKQSSSSCDRERSSMPDTTTVGKVSGKRNILVFSSDGMGDPAFAASDGNGAGFNLGEGPPPNKKRRRFNLEENESKLEGLRSENEMLGRQLDRLKNKTQKFDKERYAVEEEMRAMIGEDKETVRDDAEIVQLLKKYTELYSDYGKRRNGELFFHLDQLERLITPNSYTKMHLWTLSQKVQFFQHPQKNTIASILMSELDITPSQGKKMMDLREKIALLGENIRKSFSLMRELKKLCTHKQKVFHDRMAKCQEILSPIQTVELLLWVDKNSSVLGQVCPGWESER
uniref:Uncharacterized protein n=1 Tax=Corethron hystrix TaxID=216773 RepID=A0A7S1FWU2_9STRA